MVFYQVIFPYERGWNPLPLVNYFSRISDKNNHYLFFIFHIVRLVFLYGMCIYHKCIINNYFYINIYYVYSIYIIFIFNVCKTISKSSLKIFSAIKYNFDLIPPRRFYVNIILNTMISSVNFILSRF